MLRLACAAVVTLTVASLALSPPSASARRGGPGIVPFQSIAGVGLGASPARVRARLGRPSTVRRVRGRIVELGFDGPDVVVEFDAAVRGDPADTIAADAPRLRTAQGIHVGSTAAQAHRTYRTMRCDVGICTVYDGRPGAIGTRTLTFVFVAGRVASVQIGEVFTHGRFAIRLSRT